MKAPQSFGTIMHAERALLYFTDFAGVELGIEPERDVAVKVVALMKEAEDRPGACDDIVGLMRGMLTAEHYNGSGWNDFRNCVEVWLDRRGYHLDLRSKG